MTSSLLSLQGINPAPAVTIDPDAITQKQDCIEMAQSIVSVASQSEQTDAVAAASMIKGLLKRMEATRVEVKKPALEACQTIDRIAKGYCDTLNQELKRLEKLAADYQAECDRIANELKAQELMDMAQDEDMSEDAVRDRTERRIELAQPLRVEGASVRHGLDYEILDIAALAAARPDLVKIEPRRRELLAYINIPNVPALPGVRTFSQTILHAKAS